MAVAVIRQTPGVYITELDAFPPSIQGVQTAVPAFIGYTEKASVSGKPAFLTPIRIGSLVDYQAIFGGAFKTTYNITALKNDSTDEKKAIAEGRYDFRVWNPTATPKAWSYYDLTQAGEKDETTRKKFNLYNSLRLFYANGGGSCYVVSVGQYNGADGNPVNVSLGDLEKGLDVIKEQVGPTMLVVPDAVLIPATTGKPLECPDFYKLVKGMLAQCHDLQDRVAVLDVYASGFVGKLRDPAKPDDGKYTLPEVAAAFRLNVGEKNLNYGMAYFPFLDTSVVPLTDFNFTNLSPVGPKDPKTPTDPNPNLAQILSWQNINLYFPEQTTIPAEIPATAPARYAAVQKDINAMKSAAEDYEAALKQPDPTVLANALEKLLQISQNLTAALPLYSDILRILAVKNEVLPPSGGMAGVYSYVDATQGVWNAPANVTMDSVLRTTYKMNDSEQGDLNVPVDGKAINALREFVGRGTVVWGARTLDGNSHDWRYIQVRRTLVYIEQSIKAALQQFVFAANDANTWVRVTAMISSFLQGLWSQGGLMGAKADEAFTVQCGLGSTMTPMDILEGYMRVQVKLQMIHPAEFIELTFQQKMQGIN